MNRQLLLNKSIFAPITVTVISSLILGLTGYTIRFFLSYLGFGWLLILALLFYAFIFGFVIFLRNYSWALYTCKVKSQILNKLGLYVTVQHIPEINSLAENVKICLLKVNDFLNHQLNLILRFGLTAIFSLTALLIMDWITGIIIIGMLLSLGLILNFLFSLSFSRTKKFNQVLADFFATLTSLIQGNETLIFLISPEPFKKIWIQRVDSFLKSYKNRAFFSALLQSLSVLILTVFLFLILLYLIFRVSAYDLTDKLGLLISLGIFIVTAVVFFSFLPRFFESQKELDFAIKGLFSKEDQHLITPKQTFPGFNSLEIKFLRKNLFNFSLCIKDFCVHRGKTFIIGENGSGKTLLLRCLSGLETVDSSLIYLNSSRKDLSEISSYCVYISNQVWLFDASVKENLLSTNYTAIIEYLKLFDLDSSFLELSASSLSMGQRQIVNIIRGILCSRPILLFDEAINSLSENLQVRVLDFIETVSNAAIVVIHNESILKYFPNSPIWRMSQGELNRVN